MCSWRVRLLSQTSLHSARRFRARFHSRWKLASSRPSPQSPNPALRSALSTLTLDLQVLQAWQAWQAQPALQAQLAQMDPQGLPDP